MVAEFRSTPRQPALYVRLSEDRGGDLLGVTRQLEDGRRHAAQRGWPAPTELIDDDRSAYTGKPRPAYQEMLDGLRSGAFDGVIVYDTDRLTRQPRELEAFIDICKAAGVSHLATISGDIDLSTNDGQFHARIMGAVAKKSSDDASRRIIRKHVELAEKGEWSGGRTPYGFTLARPKQLTVVEDKAAAVRDAAERVLAGASLRSVVTDLERRGIAGPNGNCWRSGALRRILLNPSTAGLRVRAGQTFPAQWRGILTEQQHHRLTALLNAPQRLTKRSVRRYLLAGLVRCEHCGTKMVSHHRPDKIRTYACVSGVPHRGCGRMRITAEPVESFISDAVLHRLDTAEMATALDEKRKGTNADELAHKIQADREQLDELAHVYADKLITMREWLEARRAVEARLDQRQRSLARIDAQAATSAVVGQGAKLRQRWTEMDITARRAVIDAVVDSVTVLPADRHHPKAPVESRLGIVWKL